MIRPFLERYFLSAFVFRQHTALTLSLISFLSPLQYWPSSLRSSLANILLFRSMFFRTSVSLSADLTSVTLASSRDSLLFSKCHSVLWFIRLLWFIWSLQLPHLTILLPFQAKLLPLQATLIFLILLYSTIRLSQTAFLETQDEPHTMLHFIRNLRQINKISLFQRRFNLITLIDNPSWTVYDTEDARVSAFFSIFGSLYLNPVNNIITNMHVVSFCNWCATDVMNSQGRYSFRGPDETWHPSTPCSTVLPRHEATRWQEYFQQEACPSAHIEADCRVCCVDCLKSLVSTEPQVPVGQLLPHVSLPVTQGKSGTPRNTYEAARMLTPTLLSCSFDHVAFIDSVVPSY